MERVPEVLVRQSPVSVGSETCIREVSRYVGYRDASSMPLVRGGM